MKIIIAPDSFKGCMRSPAVCSAIEKGIRDILPESEVISVPMADGGEGTVEAAVKATGGNIERITVHGPLGNKTKAEFGILGDSNTAVMEMASASGLELLKNNELNPLKTSTYGTGEIIREIISRGIRKVVIGIGGSATVDGGSGMAQALGYRFIDRQGETLTDFSSGGMLSDIASIDSKEVVKGLSDCEILVACDVTNPLLGGNGAARVFGPQKGASPEMVEELEKGLSNFAGIMIREGLLKDVEQPGDGAAGGLGAGLRAFCNAAIRSGAGLMIETTGLKRHLRGADLLITGEGCTDSQTASGKLCAVIAQTASESEVPCILVSGAVKGPPDIFKDMFTASLSITRGPCSLSEALASAEENLYFAGRDIAGILKALKN